MADNETGKDRKPAASAPSRAPRRCSPRSRPGPRRCRPARAGAGMLSDTAVAEALRQAKALIDRDPLLRSVDPMWNANPMREVIPVDWAEVARALRIVWLRTFPTRRKLPLPPSSTPTSARRAGGLERGRAALVGEARAPTASRPRRRQALRAPEWQANPVYRTLKEAICSPPTGCCSRARRRTWTTPNGSGWNSICASSWMR